MIFTIEPSSNRIIATLPEITYQCKLSACSSPTCGCESIRVDFFPGDLEDEALSQVTPSAVKIDLATWRKNDQECLLIKSEFATEVIKNIDEDDYEFLMAQFYGMKHRCIEEADFSTLVADFPVKDVENNSQMLAYLEAIPHAKPYRVEINNQNYFVDDQYCVKPNCKCSEVYLSYFLIPQTQLEGKPGKNKEAFVYLIDYKKQTWKKVVGGNKSSTWTADDDIAKNTFESAYPDSWRLVQTRHLQLKQVYANSMKQRKQGKPAASIKKVGRNELCPCGSGKKYKKCCGTS